MNQAYKPNAKKPKTTAIQELTSVFELLDLEGNDDLDIAEFKVGLTSIGLHLKHDEATQLFKSIDAENSGYIDRDSFVAWLKKDINSDQIESIRNRLREAIAAAQNQDVNEDEMIDWEARRIVRKQSVLHPELVDQQSTETFVENDTPTGYKKETFEYISDEDNESKSKKNTHKNQKKSKNKNKSDSSDSKSESDDDSDLDNKDTNNNNNTKNAETEDADAMSDAMRVEYEKMKNQQLRSVTREVESRRVIRNDNAQSFSQDDISDMAGEMLQEYSRLRRQSTKGVDIEKLQQETQETISHMKQHIHEFSDSLDANTINNITQDIEIPDNYDMIGNTPALPTTLDNDTVSDPFYRSKGTASITSNGDRINSNGIVNELLSRDSIDDNDIENNENNKITKKINFSEIDPDLIDGIEALGSNKNILNNIEFDDNISDLDDDDEIKKKLTLDNQALDLQQTGNVDENELDIDITDAPHPMMENENSKDLSLRSDTVKGRAGSVIEKFEIRATNSHKSLDVLDMSGMDDEDILLMKGLTKKYTDHDEQPIQQINDINMNSNINTNMNMNMNMNLNMTTMTTRATSHSFDRLMSDHTIRSNSNSIHNNINNNINNNNNMTNIVPSSIRSAPIGMNINNNNIHNKPIIGTYTGLNGSFLPSLPRNNNGINMLHTTTHQPVMINQSPITIGNDPLHIINNTNNLQQLPNLPNQMNQMNQMQSRNSQSLHSHSRHDSFSRHSDSHHSISLSHHSQSQQSQQSQSQHSHASNQGTYVYGGTLQTDISQISSHGNENLLGNQNSIESQNWVLRFIKWYLEPIHTKDTFRRLGYHGANMMFAGITSSIMLGLFIGSILTLITCCIGLLGIYGMCELSREFAQLDIQLALYFFDTSMIPRFSIYIPTSHATNLQQKLRDYVLDPHLLQIMFYLTFLKLPSSIILSGISLVLFGGVTSVLLSPLVFWFDPDYFNEGYFCLFGSKSYEQNYVTCSGWSVESFGDTIGAFLLFLPLLPLTLHLCKYTAKLLFRVTCNFLTMDLNYGKDEDPPVEPL